MLFMYLLVVYQLMRLTFSATIRMLWLAVKRAMLCFALLMFRRLWTLVRLLTLQLSSQEFLSFISLTVSVLLMRYRRLRLGIMRISEICSICRMSLISERERLIPNTLFFVARQKIQIFSSSTERLVINIMPMQFLPQRHI